MARGDPVEFVREPGTRIWNRVQIEDAFGRDVNFASLDAFGLLRVANRFTLFDSKQIWDDPDLANNVENFPLFWDNQQTAGAGTTTTFNVNRASTTLAVSANTAGTRVRQTKQRFNYQPGKSQLSILTAVFGTTPSGITKRYGCLDGNNGIFFQNVGGTWGVGIRSFVTGAAVDRVATQANWNLDTLDGSGSPTTNPSGINLSNVAAQIFFFDFEWLGAGDVAFGFFIDRTPVYVHVFQNANVLTSVYMSNPNLPVRAEIINDGTGGASTLELICATVISEGGVNEQGVIRSGDLGADPANAIQANVVDTTYAVCGIRLKAAYLSAHIHELKVSLVEITGGNDAFLWRLHLNPTLTTGLTYSNVAQSGIQFGVALAAGDIITAPNFGYVLQLGYTSGALEQADVDLESALRLGSTIAGVSDEFVLSHTPSTVNQRALGGLTWREAW